MGHRIGKGLVWALGGIVAALPVAAHQQEAATQAPHEHQQQMSPEMQAEMEAWMKAGTPGAEHQRLAESTGTWKATVRMWMGPGEPTVSEATARREMILDGRVLAESWEGTMMGSPFAGHGMTGYDNVREMYWSTWNDNMSTAIMLGWGKWDEAEGAMVFDGEMSDPMSGGPMKVRNTVRFPELGKELFEMWEPRGEGGEMVRTMEISLVKQ
jgi:hypothetical protein